MTITTQPSINEIEKIHFPGFESQTLPNGNHLHMVRTGKQDVVRFELIFNAGTKFEQHAGQSFFAIKTLAEGTLTKTSKQIALQFEEVGASLDLSHSVDRSILSVYTLTKHLPSLLPLIFEIFGEAQYPEADVKQVMNSVLQNLKVQQEKNAYWAGQLFRKAIFGADHAAGKSLQVADIEALSVDQIAAFYQNHIKNAQVEIFLAGKFDPTLVMQIEQIWGHYATVPSQKLCLELPIAPGQELVKEREYSLQSSIRMGKAMPKVTSLDYFPFMVLNEVLGGYFGSRLMKNIREDKGYTYGIGTAYYSLKDVGYWLVGSDVKIENTRDTLKEIAAEIEKLKHELVPHDELHLVQNFIAGSMVGSLITPFDVADKVKGLILDGLPVDFYDNYIQNIRSVSAAQVQSAAQQHLVDLHTVIVGGV